MELLLFNLGELYHRMRAQWSPGLELLCEDRSVRGGYAGLEQDACFTRWTCVAVKIACCW